MRERIQYKVLADLFRYPKEDYKSNVNDCAAYLRDNYPAAFMVIQPFLDWVNSHDDYEIEELFGRTFHIQAICYLDLGYVLFAEDYKRGEFLVQVKKEQERARVDCGEELADNLPNVLKLMSVMEDEEFLKEFAVRIMKPALEKMVREFDESRIALKDKVRKKKQKVVIMEGLENRNIYQFALESIREVLAVDFKGVEYHDPIIQPTLGGNVLGCAPCGPETPPTKA